MSDLCVSCNEEVTENQEGISCDVCERWTHRKCQSEISRVQYRRAVRSSHELMFTCQLCNQTSPANATYVVLHSSLHSSMNEVTPTIDFNLSFSVTSSTDADFSELPTANSFTFEDDTTPFDITRVDAQNTTTYTEPNLNGDEGGSLILSTTVLDNPSETYYSVIEEGTKRKGKKLVSSDGFAYLVKRVTTRAVQWRCNQRRKGSICYASVRQEKDVFIPGTTEHNHQPDPLVRQKVDLRRDLKQQAVRNVQGATGGYVDEQLDKQFPDRQQ